MKESMWGYALILLGIAVSTFMIMVSNMTTTNQQDYYLLKEITNAAMIDSIDYSYYKEYGEMKINTEKFVEVFIRRFAEAVSKTNSYKIDFYNIYENPPSVSIKVTSQTGDYQIWGDSTNIDVINSYNAILEANNVITTSSVFYSIPYGSCGDGNYISDIKGNADYHYCQMAVRAKFNISEDSAIYKKIQEKIGPSTPIDINKIKVQDVEYITNLSSEADIDAYNTWYKETYDRATTLDDVPNGLSSALNFAVNIKDVNVTLKQDTTSKGSNYYLAYGLKYNCLKYGSDTENVPTIDYYRRGTTVANMEYVTETEYNGYGWSESKKTEYCKYSDDSKTGECYTKEEYERKVLNKEISDEDKGKFKTWDKAPFYNNCLVGIKYRVNFYYDDSTN